MGGVTFTEALEIVDSLPYEEQELLVEIIKKRVVEKKRRELVNAVEESWKDYATGNIKKGTVEDLLRDLTEE